MKFGNHVRNARNVMNTDSLTRFCLNRSFSSRSPLVEKAAITLCFGVCSCRYVLSATKDGHESD